MALSVVQILSLSVVSVVLWRLLRPYVVKTPLFNIPGPLRASWLKGNFDRLFDRNGWAFHRELGEKYGGAVKLHMLFGDEQLYVTDPLALHHIVVKDQYIYEETDLFISSNSVIFGGGLLSTLGEHHRKQRKMLNPVFSLKHMRGLIPIFYPITYQLRDIIAHQVRTGQEEINVMKWMSRAALEYIGQAGLGYSFEALDENKTNTFSEAIKMLGPLRFKLNLPFQIFPWIYNIGSPTFRRKFVEWMPWADVQELRRIVDEMDYNSKDILRKKRQAIEEGDEAVLRQVGMGKDIMSVLLKANADAKEEDRLPEYEILGQISTFIFAGHDTTTAAVCRILFELVMNPGVQSKLREEVTAARKEHGDLDYDILMGLPYLDAVCRETLRVYPPVPQLTRTTRKDVVLPLLWPIKSVDGKSEIKEIPLKKNTNVIISVLNANRNKKIWGEDADEWKPERWLKPLPSSVAEAHMPGVYASMMTFLGGGRACIGFKFSEMEMKLVLSVLLETFVFSPSSKEIQWAMTGLTSPVVVGSGTTFPQLPLKVSFA